jgi:glycosyltransferase involved in cell wall biosynthesis
MKIGIDISAIIYGTGVSVYTKNLIENMVHSDRVNDYLLFGGSLRRQAELTDFIQKLKSENVYGKTYPIPPTLADIIWNKLHILPIEKLAGEMDVFHSSDWTQPPSRAFKVTTIHDLSPLLFPGLTHPAIVATHKLRLKWVKKEVDRVIVPSKTTMDDCEKLGINRSIIRIIPEAVNPLIKPSKKIDVDIVKRRYRISGKYLLAVGVNPRKNTKRIIDAFEKIKPGMKLRLVIIGHPYSQIEGSKGVVFTGHVSQKEISIFYTGAEALVYPSLYEGFGLPILEAFTCNVPVVTSRVGSMKELAGKAAVLVDPNDTDSIAGGIFEALKNRKTFTTRGRTEVSKYSWKKTSEETIKVYKESVE